MVTNDYYLSFIQVSLLLSSMPFDAISSKLFYSTSINCTMKALEGPQHYWCQTVTEDIEGQIHQLYCFSSARRFSAFSLNLTLVTVQNLWLCNFHQPHYSWCVHQHLFEKSHFRPKREGTERQQFSQAHPLQYYGVVRTKGMKIFPVSHSVLEIPIPKNPRIPKTI